MRLSTCLLNFIASVLLLSGCASIVNPSAVVQVASPTYVVVVEEEAPPPVTITTTETPSIDVVAPVEPAEIVLVDAEVRCMAQAIYREARGEGVKGMAGVGYVIVNRVNSKSFRPTVCGVVHQKATVKGKVRCQFTWACSPLRTAAMRPSEYTTAREIAIKVLRQEIDNPVGKSLYFHERSRRPAHAPAKNLVAYIGSHGFFL